MGVRRAPRSKFLMARSDTPEASTKSTCRQSSNARAARIWAGTIIVGRPLRNEKNEDTPIFAQARGLVQGISVAMSASCLWAFAP